MIVTVTPKSADRAPAFYHLWLRTVTGFKGQGTAHCIHALNATRDARMSTKVRGENRIVLPKLGLYAEPGSPVNYICGVSPRGWNFNLHLALVDRPGALVEAVGFDGTRITVEDAVALVIPEVPDGFEGRALEQTRCRNWRFAQGWFAPSPYPVRVPEPGAPSR